MRKVAIILLLALILARPLKAIYEERSQFLSRGYSMQYETYQRLYYSSQYVKKDKPGIIPDQTFEAFVGGAFLKGVDPILIVHEHPPLGRYIIALSILLFDNASTLVVPLLITSIIGIFLIARLILRETLYALIPVGVFLNEPLFLTKIHITPLLEPIQLPFIVFALYFFIRGISDKFYKHWFILTSLMLGFVISIRFFILGFFMLLAMLLYFFLSKRDIKRLVFFLSSLPVALIVLILSYIKTIQDGYSIWQVFSIQKYIFFYHQSKFINFFSFWDLLFFNRWHTWWADRAIISDSQWFFAWPVAMVLTIINALFSLLKKIPVTNEEKIILLWVIMYSLLLSIGNTTTRYFLPLLPFIYILATSFIIKTLRPREGKNV